MLFGQVLDIPMNVPSFIVVTLFLLSNLIAGQSSRGLLVFADGNSPAFISEDQYYLSVNASLPYLPVSMNGSTFINHFNNVTYPNFINYSLKIGNISSANEMAMFLAQVLYQSNGLTLHCDPACYDAKSANCQSLNLNATAFGTSVNYYGRGYLWLQGQSMYGLCNSQLFGDDVTMLMYPDAIRENNALNWAVTSWYWKTFVQPNMTTFGSTTKMIRPYDCSGSPNNPSYRSGQAWNIYVAILQVLSPGAAPSSGSC